jgi:hypothetical protein
MIDFRVKIFDAEWQGHDGFKMELEYYQQQDKSCLYPCMDE